MDLLDRFKLIKNISQDYKKKRIILDENKLNFGFEVFSSLKKVTNEDGQVKGYPFKLYNKKETQTPDVVFCPFLIFNKVITIIIS